jgi:ABC-2 type transport system permease protein
MVQFFTVFLKELITFLRSKGLVLAVLYLFTLDVYIAGEGLEIKPKNVAVGYYTTGFDKPLINKLLLKFKKPEFKKPVRFNSEKQLFEAIYNKKITVGLVFDNSERNFYKEGRTRVDIFIDATSAGQAYLTLTYIEGIILQLENGLKLPLKVKIHKLFNQNGDTKKFIPFSEMVSALSLVAIILSAAFFVRERENGTWDLLLLTPVDSRIVIFAKIAAQVFITLLFTLISIGLILFAVFDIPFRGSFLLFIFLTVPFLFALSGIGLFIASVTETMLGVALLTLLILLPIMFLSGTWTPLSSAAPIVQYLSYLSPLRYYYDSALPLFFIGINWEQYLKDFFALVVLSSILFWFGYRRIGRLF